MGWDGLMDGQADGRTQRRRTTYRRLRGSQDSHDLRQATPEAMGTVLPLAQPVGFGQAKAGGEADSRPLAVLINWPVKSARLPARRWSRNWRLGGNFASKAEPPGE